MLIALLGLLAVLSVPVAGGRLSRLLDLHLRFTWVLLLGLLIQVFIISIVPGASDDWLHRALHLGTYGLGFLWLAANPSFPWRWILTIGGALNFLVIAVNGGVMPASESALLQAGEKVGEAFTNSTAVEGARLAFLGDVFTVPSWVPFGNVFSIGDVLIVVGGFLMVHAACESRIGRLLCRSRTRRPVAGRRMACEQRGGGLAGHLRSARARSALRSGHRGDRRRQRRRPGANQRAG